MYIDVYSYSVKEKLAIIRRTVDAKAQDRIPRSLTTSVQDQIIRYLQCPHSKHVSTDDV